MIRFSASLVVVGIGLLVAGGVTSRLPLIYIAIGVSAVALLFLIIGAIVNRAELLGREPESVADGQTERDQRDRDEYAGELDKAPEPATTAVGASAGASVGRGYAGERAADPGYGAAPTPPDRPRVTSFPDQPVYRDHGDAEPARGASRYERFAGDGDRGRPPQPQPQPRPQRPFTEPEPTRMDLSAADVREAGRQQRKRSEPGQSPGQPVDQPFVDPEPTRMDWAGGLREAERQERARQDQERRAREHPERDRIGGDRTDQPFVDPEPTRMDWAADFREHDQRGGTAAPGRPSGERETAHTDQVAPTRPTPVQQPAPTQPTPAPPDKLLVSRPDSKSPLEPGERPEEPEGREQPREQQPREPAEQPQEPEQATAAAGVQPPSSPSAKPDADRPGSNDAGDTERSAEQAATGPERHRPPHAGQRDPRAGRPGTGDGRPARRPARGHRRPGQLRIRARTDGGRRTRSGRDRGPRCAPLPPQRLHPDPVHGRGRPAADAGRTGPGSGLHPVPGLPARRRRGRLSASGRPPDHSA